jgi:glycosyltransferase involved in cell wall biosynthesis
MPVRNEAQHIERSLGAVLAQDYPNARLEVLVVDGMSDDQTREIVCDLKDALSHTTLRLLDNEDRIVTTALNIGVRAAAGEVIILVGGHCEISPEYVPRCVNRLRETGADCVGGQLFTVGETLAAKAIALAQSSFFGVGGVAFRTGRQRPTYVDTVAFGAYRRDVFDRIGDFDEELVRNQDDEFNYRLVQAGGRILLDPSISAVYYSRANLKKLWRQYFQYGYYKVRVMQKLGEVPSWRHLVPAAFVLGLIGSLLLALATQEPLWASSVAGAYALANVVASLWVARKQPETLPILPLAFFILHFAYGTGFLWGLWQWRDRWPKRESPV